MKALKEINKILLQLDSQAELDEVVVYFSSFESHGGGGESAVTLDELREDFDLEPLSEEEQLYDPEGPEDGGHPY
jgi:hypothetical protein